MKYDQSQNTSICGVLLKKLLKKSSVQILCKSALNELKSLSKSSFMFISWPK